MKNGAWQIPFLIVRRMAGAHVGKVVSAGFVLALAQVGTHPPPQPSPLAGWRPLIRLSEN